MHDPLSRYSLIKPTKYSSLRQSLDTSGGGGGGGGDPPGGWWKHLVQFICLRRM